MCRQKIFSRPKKKLSKKECLFCKKEFEGQANSKYCSLECKKADKKAMEFVKKYKCLRK